MTSHDDCLSDSTVYNTLMNVSISIPLQSHTVKGATSHTDKMEDTVKPSCLPKRPIKTQKSPHKLYD